MRSWVSL